MSKPTFGRIFVVINANENGQHCKAWGMKPGVFGNSFQVRYWTYLEIDIISGECVTTGWHYPSKTEAEEGARKARRALKQHALRFGWHPTFGLHKPRAKVEDTGGGPQG